MLFAITSDSWSRTGEDVVPVGFVEVVFGVVAVSVGVGLRASRSVVSDVDGVVESGVLVSWAGLTASFSSSNTIRALSVSGRSVFGEVNPKAASKSGLSRKLVVGGSCF